MTGKAFGFELVAPQLAQQAYVNSYFLLTLCKEICRFFVPEAGIMMRLGIGSEATVTRNICVVKINKISELTF